MKWESVIRPACGKFGHIEIWNIALSINRMYRTRFAPPSSRISAFFMLTLKQQFRRMYVVQYRIVSMSLFHTTLGQLICMICSHYSSWPRSARQGRCIPDLYDLYDLYDLAHVAGLEPYNLHDLAQVSWVGYVLHRSCTTSHNGRLGSTWSIIDRDLSDLSVRSVRALLLLPYHPTLNSSSLSPKTWMQLRRQAAWHGHTTSYIPGNTHFGSRKSALR